MVLPDEHYWGLIGQKKTRTRGRERTIDAHIGDVRPDLGWRGLWPRAGEIGPSAQHSGRTGASRPTTSPRFRVVRHLRLQSGQSA